VFKPQTAKSSATEPTASRAGSSILRTRSRFESMSRWSWTNAFTNPEATALGKKFNLPLRYDAKVNKEAEGEASKFFADVFKE
jgi:hypothetical protein